MGALVDLYFFGDGGAYQCVSQCVTYARWFFQKRDNHVSCRPSRQPANNAASHFRPVTAAQRRVLVVVVEAALAGKLPTQKEVASIASVSEGQVSRWNRDPEWRKAVALAYDEAREGAWRRADRPRWCEPARRCPFAPHSPVLPIGPRPPVLPIVPDLRSCR
jgi:hypothetical protein